MKFQPDRLDGANAIVRCDDDAVWVAGDGAPQRFDGALVVPWRGPVLAWAAASADALSPGDFEPVLALEPEVVLIGSGARLRFVAPARLAAFYARRVGVETMDTRAACRTYNVLAAEGRRVVAALLPPRA